MPDHSDIENESVVGQLDVLGQVVVGLFMIKVVGDMREVGLARAQQFHHLDCLIYIEMGRVLSVSKRTQHECVQTLQFLQGGIRNAAAVGHVGESTHAIGQHGQSAV